MLIIRLMGPNPKSAALSGLPFYVWEVPDKPISIQLYFDVVDRMSPEVLRGLGALKRRGAEVGGLLLGRVEHGIVTIEDFEPVPSEYLTGPSYNLSAKDLVGFEAAIGARQADRDGLDVVGFYRSHTRDNLFMDEGDAALAARYFSDPGNVFLLIKPFATRASIAGFFFWEDGEINREASYREFPFHRAQLGGGEPRVVASASRPPAQERPPLPAQERPPLPPPFRQAPEPEPPTAHEEDDWAAIRQSNLSILQTPPEPKRLQWRWLIAPVFLVLAGLAGYFGYQNLSGSRAQVAPPPPMEAPGDTALPLKLSVAEKQDQLDVTWDRNAPAIALAQRGVLSISDGANRRELELTGAQLRNGRVLYSRLSADVGLRLDVFPEGRETVSESIRIVAADPAPSLPAPSLPSHVSPAEPAPLQRELAGVPETAAPVIAPSPKKTARRRLPETPAVESPKPAAVTPAPEAPPPEVELQRPARRR